MNLDTSMAKWGMKNPGLASEAGLIISQLTKSYHAQNGKELTLSELGALWSQGNEADYAGGGTLRNAYTQSWIYACISLIAQNVANVPFVFSRGLRNRENLIEEGEFVDLFRRPHPAMSSYIFWELLTTWLMLRGRAFVVALNASGQVIPLDGSVPSMKPARLVILNSDRVQKVVESHELVGWRYLSGYEDPLEAQVFLPGEVVFLRQPNPFDFWDGFAPCSVALLAAQTDYAAQQFMKGLMLNNADTGVIVTTDQQPSKEQREAILAALKRRKRKAGTADAPMFLWGGSRIEKPPISMVDIQFLENRQFSLDEVCAIFHMSKEMLGMNTDANRSVGDAARLNFIENNIAPMCARMDAEIAPIIAQFDPRMDAFHDVHSLPIMQTARRQRYASAAPAFAMGIPIDICSQVFDLGLPKLPHDGKSFLPYSLQEVGPGGELEKEEPAANDKPKEEETPMDKALTILKAASIAPPLRHSSTPPHTCAANPEYEASIAGAVRQKRGKLRSFFFSQRGRVLAALAKGYAAKKGMEICSVDDVFEFPMDSENAELLKKLKPALLGDLDFGGAQLFREIGVDDFKLPPVKATEFLKTREKKIEEINETTFRELTDSLEEGLANGDTQDQLTQRVKDIFTNASESRAETIALTETNTAINSGRFIGMEEAKVELKGWKASNLDNVRATHLAAEGDYSAGIPLNEPFMVGGAALMHPCDPRGPASEVINCRCFCFAIIPADKSRRGITQKLMTWEEFLTVKESKHER